MLITTDNWSEREKLTVGNTYTILRSSLDGGQSVMIKEGHSGTYWIPSRCFAKTEPASASASASASFEVGDRVKLVEYDYWAARDRLKVGNTYTVGEVDGNNSITLKEGPSSYWIASDLFEKAEQAELFEIGDRVKLIREDRYSKERGMKIGETYTIRFVGSDNFLVMVDGTAEYWLASDQFEKVEQVEVGDPPKFPWDKLPEGTGKPFMRKLRRVASGLVPSRGLSASSSKDFHLPNTLKRRYLVELRDDAIDRLRNRSSDYKESTKLYYQHIADRITHYLAVTGKGGT